MRTLTFRGTCKSIPYNETRWNTLHVADGILKWEQETPKCPPGNNTCIKTGCISGTAIQFATSTAALAVPKIITTLDPDRDADSTLKNILTAPTIGLPFLSIPAVGALVPAATSTVGTLLVTALQQAPSVSEAIWIPDGKSTQVVQMGELASKLSGVNAEIGAMLDRGLVVVMKDVSAFAKFTSGSFSAPDVISIPKEEDKLDLAIKAHLVTKAMTANDWWVCYGPPDNADGTWFNSTTESNAKKYVCNTTPEDDICDTIDSRGISIDEVDLVVLSHADMMSKQSST
ncbi:MAG: hypothetical protein L6R42_003786 [Xanthoria sp. 1 TBL-2021]|nr:MAG: hypothetical protein L6R42_003786 [Xanthoria sp. 1 TBL-2021]